MNIDDPMDAGSVHFANGIWGAISCGIFDATQGLVSGSPGAWAYLGLQIYGALAILLWGIATSLAFWVAAQWLGVLTYHPLLQIFGSYRFKMGELSYEFLSEVRNFNEG